MQLLRGNRQGSGATCFSLFKSILTAPHAEALMKWWQGPSAVALKRHLEGKGALLEMIQVTWSSPPVSHSDFLVIQGAMPSTES